MSLCIFIFVFFCKQKTAYEMRISDWSSDVCSSDLSAVSPLQVAFFRYLAGFCIILPFFLRSYGLRQALPEFATPAKRPLTAGHALRGSIGIAGVALGAYAVTHIPLANAQAIAMKIGRAHV